MTDTSKLSAGESLEDRDLRQKKIVYDDDAIDAAITLLELDSIANQDSDDCKVLAAMLQQLLDERDAARESRQKILDHLKELEKKVEPLIPSGWRIGYDVDLKGSGKYCDTEQKGADE